jgi:hypothetical protein
MNLCSPVFGFVHGGFGKSLRNLNKTMDFRNRVHGFSFTFGASRHCTLMLLSSWNINPALSEALKIPEGDFLSPASREECRQVGQRRATGTVV